MATGSEMNLQIGDEAYMVHVEKNGSKIKVQDAGNDPDEKVTVSAVKITDVGGLGRVYKILWTNRPGPLYNAGAYGLAADQYDQFTGEGEEKTAAELARLGIGVRRRINSQGEVEYSETRFPPRKRR